MITPSPTTEIEPGLARGTLTEVRESAGVTITLSIANSSYGLLLHTASKPSTPIGKRIVGRISVKARRVDPIPAGGVYVEPVTGRPRRVQGRVISISDSAPAITVDAGVPIELVLTAPGQSPRDFQPGMLVSCDVLPGATFEPVEQG